MTDDPIRFCEQCGGFHPGSKTSDAERDHQDVGLLDVEEIDADELADEWEGWEE